MQMTKRRPRVRLVRKTIERENFHTRHISEEGTMMHHVKDLVGWILAALSAYMVIKGAGLYLQTAEGVRVFEVTMLITLANQLALIMMWLGLLAIWKVLPGPLPVKCSGGSDVKHGGSSSTIEGRGDTKTEPVISMNTLK